MTGRSTPARRSRGATSWSPTTTTPAQAAWLRGARASTCSAATAASTARARGRGRRRALTARHVVLATGSEPVIPPVPGLRELDGVWTNREATAMTEVPRRLLVLGAGAGRRRDGAGGAAHGRRGRGRRGHGPRPAARAAARWATRSARRSRADGVELHFGQHAARRGARTATTCSSSRTRSALRGDRLLVATGRRPRVDGLGLETVGVERRTARASRSMRAWPPATACGRSAT